MDFDFKSLEGLVSQGELEVTHPNPNLNPNLLEATHTNFEPDHDLGLGLDPDLNPVFVLKGSSRDAW